MSQTSSDHNMYIEIMAKFRRAYAEYGDSLFFVGVATPEELRADPDLGSCYLCHIPLQEDGSGWRVVAARRPSTEAAWQLFRDLATLAGAALPLAVRRKIPVAPADPLGWWMSFLWWLKPPKEEDLAEPDGIHIKSRAIWCVPFLESIDAIESCKLHTDHPEFPPGTLAQSSEKQLASPDQVNAQAPSGQPATTSDDPDAQEIGKWVFRPGEASHDGGAFFDVAGVLRDLLIRLAEAKGRTVSNDRLKEACGNKVMEDVTLRNHVHKLNKILKAMLHLETNPITPAGGAYRLQLPQTLPLAKLQTKHKRISNGKRDRH